MEAKKNIVIIGAGGMAREILFLLEKSNKWNILGMIDNENKGNIRDYPILGNDDYLREVDNKIFAVCAVGSPALKKHIVSKFIYNNNISFPNIIDEDVGGDFQSISIGKGCIVCAGNRLTVDIEIGDFVTINQSCTVGHDVVIKDYAVINPGVNISGNVMVGEGALLGVGSQIIQGKSIGDGAVIGAGAVVIHDIPAYCTAVGVPACVIERHLV